jgi:hypothetical protein
MRRREREFLWKFREMERFWRYVSEFSACGKTVHDV